jgi:hypothetical protein
MSSFSVTVGLMSVFEEDLEAETGVFILGVIGASSYDESLCVLGSFTHFGTSVSLSIVDSGQWTVDGSRGINVNVCTVNKQ